MHQDPVHYWSFQVDAPRAVQVIARRHDLQVVIVARRRMQTQPRQFQPSPYATTLWLPSHQDAVREAFAQDHLLRALPRREHHRTTLDVLVSSSRLRELRQGYLKEFGGDVRSAVLD